MKVWRLLDDNDLLIASVPVSDLLDPAAEADGRSGPGVYEALSATGEVIYTGRTNDLSKRLRAHSTQSPWWGFATSIRWTPAQNYGESVALERIAISADHGDWNVHGHRELPTHARRPVPAAMAARLQALYADRPTADVSADLDNYIATARHLGWTLSAIAEPLSITREAVRLRSLQGVVDHDLFIPRPPRRPAAVGKVWPTFRPGEREEMQRLQAMATRVRRLTPLDHPNRLASERLSEMMAEVRLRGVRDREVAEALGITLPAVRARIARHGYRNNPPSQPDYAPTPAELRNQCHQGHEFSADNTRFINGDPKRRVCLICERGRVRRYRERQAMALQAAS